jgi:hypothetical protein
MPGPAGRFFRYDEALDLFPHVRDVTAQAVRAVEELTRDLTNAEDPDAGREAFDEAYRQVVARWTAEIEALGGEAKGLWLVDFDAGDGYFCWKHPEPALAHFHGYDEGFAGRVPVA